MIYENKDVYERLRNTLGQAISHGLTPDDLQKHLDRIKAVWAATVPMDIDPVDGTTLMAVSAIKERANLKQIEAVKKQTAEDTSLQQRLAAAAAEQRLTAEEYRGPAASKTP